MGSALIYSHGALIQASPSANCRVPVAADDAVALIVAGRCRSAGAGDIVNDGDDDGDFISVVTDDGGPVSVNGALALAGIGGATANTRALAAADDAAVLAAALADIAAATGADIEDRELRSARASSRTTSSSSS